MQAKAKKSASASSPGLAFVRHSFAAAWPTGSGDIEVAG
ncbi:hypothetical protein J2R96_002042 [Bradyrhizobium elkanii]|nr:hypothetical protein [Bradyrhizobium elkanii]